MMAVDTRGSSSEAGRDAGVLIITSCFLVLTRAGRWMLAWQLTTMLPTMILAEAIETTCIHSIAAPIGDRTATANRGRVGQSMRRVAAKPLNTARWIVNARCLTTSQGEEARPFI